LPGGEVPNIRLPPTSYFARKSAQRMVNMIRNCVSGGGGGSQEQDEKGRGHGKALLHFPRVCESWAHMSRWLMVRQGVSFGGFLRIVYRLSTH